MKKLLLICTIFLTLISTSQLTIDAQEQNTESFVSVLSTSKKIYHTVYYPYSIYNMNANSPNFNPFPSSYFYNDGIMAGHLYISSWETGPNAYKVTYYGRIGKQYADYSKSKEVVDNE